MGDSLGKGEFTFRLHYKPLIRWLWAGGILMAFGALLASSDYAENRKNNEQKLLFLHRSLCF